MAVVDTRFYDIHTFLFLKNGFYKGSLKISVFSRLWGKKFKILNFQNSHFVEQIILHLTGLFVRFALKSFFANFLTLSRFW